MDSDGKTRAATTARVMMEIRIVWNIGGRTGNSLWVPETGKTRTRLVRVFCVMCDLPIDML